MPLFNNLHGSAPPNAAFSLSGLLNSTISTCTFATDGTGDITVGATHGLSAGQLVRFSTTGALPTEIDVNGQYFVLSAGLTTTKLRIALTAGGTVITFAGAGTGTHSIWKTTISAATHLSALGYLGGGTQEWYESRGVSLILPGLIYQMPDVSLAPRTGLLDTFVGVCTFNGVTISVSAAHGLSANQPVRFSGEFNSPLAPNPTYYVLSSGLTTRQLQVSTSVGGVAVDFGQPDSDVWLNTTAPTLPKEIKPYDVLLYPVRSTIWKTTNTAVSHLSDFGWIYWFKAAFAWQQIISLTASETLLIASTADTNFQRPRSTSETLTIADAPVEAKATSAVATETLVIADSPVFLITQMRYATESLSTADAPTIQVGYRRDSTQILVCAAANFLAFTLFRSPVENLLVSDAPSLFFPRNRFAAELLSMTDEARRFLGPTAFSSEALTFTDSATRRVTLGRIALPLDALSIAVLASNLTPLFRTIRFPESLSCTFKNKQAVDRIIQHHRFVAFSDLTLTIAIIANSPVHTGFGATESLLIAEAASRLFDQNPVVTDALNIADLLDERQSYHADATDALVIADFSGFSLITTRSTVEALVIADLAERAALAQVSSAEESLSIAVSAFDQLARLWFRTAAESLVIASDDAVGRIMPRLTASEALSIAIATVGRVMPRLSASETLTIAEAAVDRIMPRVSASETLVIAESPFIRILPHFFATDSLLIADLPFVRIMPRVSAAEFLSIADLAAAFLVTQRNTTESLLIVDAPARLVALLRQLEELLQISELAETSKHKTRAAAEFLAIYDYAAWMFGLGDPWEYWLDLRTGNPPVESNLDLPDAVSVISTPEAETAIETPEAESELVGSTAESGGFRYIDP